LDLDRRTAIAVLRASTQRKLSSTVRGALRELRKSAASVRNAMRSHRDRNRLRRSADSSSIRLVVGSSGHHDPGWLPTDAEYLNLLRPADWRSFFAPASITAILAEHVWEHLDLEEGRAAAACCFEYLKPGGYLRVAVPDGLHPSSDYIDQVKPGGTGDGAHDHKVLYTCATFAAVFQSVGFEVRLLEYFDAAGTFQCREWNPADGLIRRSQRFDRRNIAGALHYTSIILDAVKPA
jgi:predicted SAM-dependent methyltransferase